MIFLPPLPALELPPKPAIVRPASLDYHVRRVKKLLPGPMRSDLAMPWLAGAFCKGSALPTVAFKGTAYGTVNASSYTFSSKDFGTAAASRRIVVANSQSHLTANINNPNACTIGGVTATLVFASPPSTGSGSYQLWIAAVPTGTTGNIVISRAADMGFMGIAWWAVYDLSSSTAVDADKGSSFANPSSQTLTVSDGGIVIAFWRGGSSVGHTWTGPTEDFDQVAGSGTASGIYITGASKAQCAAPSLSVSLAGESNQFIAASFR